MSQNFSSRFFVGNRQKLRSLVEAAVPIAVTANGLLQRNSDCTFPFRQDSNFWYLTGITEPDVILVMEEKDEYLIVPERESVRAVFDGAIDTTGLAKTSGMTTIVDENEGWQRLRAYLKKSQYLASPAAASAYEPQHGMYTNPSRARLVQRIKADNPNIEMQDIRKVLAKFRMLKQPAEIKAIQWAIDITTQSIATLTQTGRLQTYHNEYEIEADLTREFRSRGASDHAFAPIIASGKRACTLHNVANNGKTSPDDLLVMDVGAEVDMYAADITRTVALGTPTKRQRAVHAAVLDVQKFGFSQLKPGADLKACEQAIEHMMGEKLRELGLIKTIEHEAVRRYYPHASSHFMGLDVHDVGDYRLPLEAGVVLTCEPGIYIPEEGIGVRIEDDILITKEGHKILSDLPRELV